jgi:hypothetical protein
MSELQNITSEELANLAEAAETEAQETRDKSKAAETISGKWLLENEAETIESKAIYWRAEITRREAETEYRTAKTRFEIEFTSDMVECWNIMVEYHKTCSNFLAALGAYMKAETEGKTEDKNAEGIAEAWNEVLKWKAQVEDWSAKLGCCRTKAEISRCDWAIESEKWTAEIRSAKRVSLPKH